MAGDYIVPFLNHSQSTLKPAALVLIACSNTDQLSTNVFLPKTLAIRGANDTSIGVEAASNLRAFSNVREIVIGANHLCHLKPNNDKFNKLLVSFLDELPT